MLNSVLTFLSFH